MFRLRIESTFNTPDSRGTVIVGMVESGRCELGDTLNVFGAQVTCAGIEFADTLWPTDDWAGYRVGIKIDGEIVAQSISIGVPSYLTSAPESV